MALTGIGAHDLDFLDQQPVSGELLATHLAAGPLSGEEALRYAIEIGSTLKKIHDRGMVHGALSPFTIRLTATGVSIVQPSPQSATAGAAYRAPEQVRGEQPDARSDIYAFGAILYEMAAGVRAFPGEAEDLNRSILNDRPPNLPLRSSIDNAMAVVIGGCLEKNPASRRQRIQNAVIELRFGAKGAAKVPPSRPAAAARKPQPPVAPVPGSIPPDIAEPGTEPAAAPAEPVDTAPPKRASRGRGSKALPPEALRAEQFFYKPGEPLVRVRPANQAVGWRALFEGGGQLSVSGFPARLAASIAVCLILVGAAVLGVVTLLRPHASGPVLKFAVAPPENTAFPGSPAVSPDGRNLAFSAQGPEGKRTLWLRPLDALRNTPISGTEGATNPFWSPDGQSLAYFAQQTLRIVRLKDNSTETVCKVEGVNGGGTWNRDNTILFSRGSDDGLYRVAGRGASLPEPVLRVRAEKGESGYLWPQFLPDGKHFVFYVKTESTETTGVYGGSLEPAEYHMLLPSETNAVYSALPDAVSQKNGYLLYINGRKLMGQAFNAPKMGLAGEPMTIADDIGAVRSLFLAPISVSANATLVYASTGKATRQLGWFDRSGNAVTEVREAGEWGPPRISPDGRRAIAGRIPQNSDSPDLWRIDSNGAVAQLASAPAHEGAPVWSPDGSKIVSFVSGKEEGNHDLYVRAAEAGAHPELLFRSAFATYPTDWSRDGRYIFFNAHTDGTKDDVWAVSTSDRRAGPILDTVNVERDAVLSPDGKWLAYASDESGRLEVYVQSFNGIENNARRRWKISSGEAGLPKWRGDGKELFFMTAGGRIMSVAAHPSAETFEFDAPVKLFQTRPIPKQWNFFDVTADGQKFVVNLPLEWASSSQIMVITNWTEKLRD